ALIACESVYGTASFTVADVMRKTTGKDVREPELRAALLALTGRDELAPHPLGLALRRVRGRVIGGRCFERAEDDSHRKVGRWQVAGNGGDCGNSFSPRTKWDEEDQKGIGLKPFPQPPPFPAELSVDEQTDAERAIAGAGDRLRVQGPAILEPLAVRPLEAKPEILAAPLDEQDVAIPPLEPCRICKSRQFWRYAGGRFICSLCHPCPCPELVVEKITLAATIPNAMAALLEQHGWEQDSSNLWSN